MKRHPAPAFVAVLLSISAILTACGGSSGPLGTLPVASTGPDPSVDLGSPDLTPAPSDLPSSGPSGDPSTPAGSEVPSGSAGPSASPEGTTIVRAYLWLGGGKGSAGLVPVLREVPATKAVARAAVTAVLAGPTSGEAGRSISSEIPSGTQLLGITIESNVATVDLSGEFASGSDSTAVRTRFAQVVYTVTQFSNVKSVAFHIDGQPATVYDGAGTALDRPATRADYVPLLSWIWVDRPAFDAAIGNPARVTGNTDVFEATFRVSILDGAGKVLVDEMAMATCGSGCRGTFDVTLDYTVAKAQYGTLRVYNLSARDGSPEAIRDYRVWLTP
jgi:germination protein M